MAEVTGFTADRMRIIENETVVDGEVQGDNLVLLTRQGVPIDAGNVRGPKGDQGNPGTPGQVQSVNNETGAVHSPRIFADKAALDLWTTAPEGAHAYTISDKSEWVRVSGVWMWVAAPRIFADKAALDLQLALAPNGAHAYTIAEQSDWVRQGGIWVLVTTARVFDTVAQRDSLWPNAPFGSRCYTKDWHINWTKRSGPGTVGWSPDHCAMMSANSTTGGFPAGSYAWPGTPYNIATYFNANVLLPGGLTAFYGVYTVDCMFQCAPTDAGDVILRVVGSDKIGVATSMMSFGAMSLSVQMLLGAGNTIVWSMYKHTNTAAWSSSAVRFGLSFTPATQGA